MFSNLATRIWFKTSDHRLIARYCTLSAIMESFGRAPPAPTYEVVRSSGGDDAEPAVKTVLIKRNPAYDQMLATMRELRAIEDQIAGNPKARFGMERTVRPNGDKERPATPQEPATPGAPARKPSPLGVLKPARNLN